MKYLKIKDMKVFQSQLRLKLSPISDTLIPSLMSLILLSVPYSAYANPGAGAAPQFKATVIDPSGHETAVRVDSSSSPTRMHESSDEEMPQGRSLRERGRVGGVRGRPSHPVRSFIPVASEEDQSRAASASPASDQGSSRSRALSEASVQSAFIISVIDEDGSVRESFLLPSEQENAKVLSAARAASVSAGGLDQTSAAVAAVVHCSEEITHAVSPAGAGGACAEQGQGHISPLTVGMEKFLSASKRGVVAFWQSLQKSFKPGQRISITEKGTGRTIIITLDKALGKGMWGQVFKLKRDESNVKLSLNGAEYDGDVVVKFGHVLGLTQGQNISSKVRIRGETDIYDQFEELKTEINDEVKKLMGERGAEPAWRSDVLPVCPILGVNSGESAGAAAGAQAEDPRRLKTHFGPMIFKPFLKGQFLERMSSITKEQEKGLQDMFDYVKAVDIAHRNAKIRKTQEEVSRFIQEDLESRRERGKSVDEKAMKKLEMKYAPLIEEAKKTKFNTDLRPTNLIWLDDPSVYRKYGYSRPGWFLIEQDSAPGNYIDGMTIGKYRIELDGYLSAAAAAERTKAKK